MKKVKIEIELFEKGDMVSTPGGDAIVNSDEEFDPKQRSVEVMWLETTSEHTKGSTSDLDVIMVYLKK
jgi:hypothetical protein